MWKRAPVRIHARVPAAAIFVEASLSLAAATYSRGRHGSPNDVTKTSQENYRAGHLLEVVTPSVWSIY